MKTPIVPFFIPHHGCPHRCVFCNQQAQTGSGARLPDAAAILATVAAYRASSCCDSPEVAYYGGTFTSLPRAVQERFLAPLQPLLREGGVRAVRVSTRPDAITPEGVAFLREHGVETVELGVQSMDDTVLAAAGRGHTAHDTVTASRILREAGMRVGMQLLPGLPGDTSESAGASLTEVLALGPDFLRIYPLLVLTDTPLAEAYRSGAFSPWSLAEAVAVCKQLLHRSEQAGVPVIRVGVQASDKLAAPGTILAGPWHPAFRQLVEGERWFDLVAALAAALPAEARLELSVPSGRLSDLVGQRRGNVARWREQLGISVARTSEDPSLEQGECLIRWDDGERRGSLLRDLVYK